MLEDATEKTFTISEVVDITGISEQTIVNWEKQGKIGPIKRDWKKWRKFTQKDIEKILEVKGSRSLGS